LGQPHRASTDRLTLLSANALPLKPGYETIQVDGEKPRIRYRGQLPMLDNLFTPTHLLFVLAIALLVFGPRKLPELGKGLGEGLRGFKQGIKGEPEATVVKSEAAKPESTSEIK